MVPSPFMPRFAHLSELTEVLSRAFKNIGSPRDFSDLEQTLNKTAKTRPPDGKVLLSLARELRIESQSQDDATLRDELPAGANLAPKPIVTNRLLTPNCGPRGQSNYRGNPRGSAAGIPTLPPDYEMYLVMQ